ncbi:Glucosidase II beta subunit-like protein [Aphelenchoides fujianensis]|nr:Glucosidase II beta subunit-like protein [Aphelenchoides fujianensis]
MLANLLAGADHEPDLIPMSTSDNENYLCIVPDIAVEKRSRITDYVGPSPRDLIAAVYREKFCSLRIESYWSYQLCHGRFLHQFHAAKETKTRLEYVLGNGEPRETTVLYICAQDSVRSIVSINEVKSCVYEVVVSLKELCTHPSFKKEDPIENEIQCFSTDSTADDPTPKAMRKFQTEVKTRPMLPIKSNQGPLTQRVPTQGIANEVYSMFKQQQAKKAEAEGGNLAPAASGLDDEDAKMLAAFWRGEACMYGGTGYWKFEFCHLKSVSQFHDEADGKTTRVNLGYFDEKLHTEWVKEAGVQVRKMDNAGVQQISNVYTRGDICTETKRLRKCEVRLMCTRPTAKDDDPHAINMFLTEPNQCDYILLVESPLFCEKLQDADEWGLLPRTPDSSQLAHDGIYLAEMEEEEEYEGEEEGEYLDPLEP